MRIYLQTIPSVGESLRYYHLHLQPDLLSGWNVVRESGVQGRSGQVKKEHFELREEAEKALTKWRDRQIKRGFRVMFREGTVAL
jgi:predicted DNA-binding WGR domain protein